jgi:hypothetical protein
LLPKDQEVGVFCTFSSAILNRLEGSKKQFCAKNIFNNYRTTKLLRYFFVLAPQLCEIGVFPLDGVFGRLGQKTGDRMINISS